MKTPCTLDADLARRLAVEADVDPRTIHAAFRGRRVRGMAGRRALAVLARHGLTERDGIATPPTEGPEAPPS